MSDAALPDLSPMPVAYGALLRRVVDVLGVDDRVRAVALHGAVARGRQDAGSDLDVLVTVRDDALDHLVESHEDWIASVTDWVSLQRMGAVPGWYVLTPTCERLDLVLERVGDVSSSPHTRRVVVLDKDGVLAGLPEVADPGADPGTIDTCLREPLRQMANFPVVFMRQDWLLGVVAVQQLHAYLYLLLAEDAKPQAPTGPKQWSAKLRPEHRALLERLPVPQAEPESVLMAWRAAVDALLRLGPEVAERHGVAWPDDLARAVLAHNVAHGYRPPGSERVEA